jgi:ABC-type Fe3+/spermidine/putrescine transport system ATPase subunit
MAPILELRNLVKHFPGQQAVREISLAIPRGSFFSLLGPSGCGKTTTLRLIAGFEQPTSGDILLDGEIVNQRKPYERNVSTVFQNYALFPHLTARGNVEFGLKRHRATDIDARVREVLQLVGLTGKENRRPAQLSGGERQRVALARSLVLQPGVLLLDEPLAALDPKLRKQMRVELKAMQRRAGVTFLLVTHDQEEALSMSDHLAVMNEGRIEQVGSPEDVYLRPRSRFVAGFLGAVNWISGAGIRPETVRLLPAGPADNVTPGDATPGDATPGDATRDRRVPGVVTGTVFLGDCVQVLVRLSSGEDAVAQLPRRAALFQPGDAVQFTWSAADEMTFP